MPELTVEFSVYCKTCNESLFAEADQHRDVYVEPCDNCLKDEGKDSYNQGHEEGYAKAREELE